jgi:hypothetical protein
MPTPEEIERMFPSSIGSALRNREEFHELRRSRAAQQAAAPQISLPVTRDALEVLSMVLTAENWKFEGAPSLKSAYDMLVKNVRGAIDEMEAPREERG